MSILDWPDVLRRSPIFQYPVEVRNNFENNRPLGNLSNLSYLLWHHDGSPVGPSSGALDWIINAYNNENPSAQIWISYTGTWFFVGSGRAYHCGVTTGELTYSNSVGTETDHTTGEVMSPRLLDSIRRGYASILKYEGWPATRMRFHKIEARPVGRKPDPDFGSSNPDVWQQEWNREVATIQGFMNQLDGGTVAPPITPPVIVPPSLVKPTNPPEEEMAMVVVRNNGVDYMWTPWLGKSSLFRTIKTEGEYNLYFSAGLITVGHGAAKPANMDLIQWMQGQIQATGGDWDSQYPV